MLIDTVKRSRIDWTPFQSLHYHQLLYPPNLHLLETGHSYHSPALSTTTHLPKRDPLTLPRLQRANNHNNRNHHSKNKANDQPLPIRYPLNRLELRRKFPLLDPLIAMHSVQFNVVPSLIWNVCQSVCSRSLWGRGMRVWCFDGESGVSRW